jgi:hypothetical protein
MHGIYEREIGTYPDLKTGESNELTEGDVTSRRKDLVRKRLWQEAFNVELLGVDRDFGSLSTLVAKHATLLYKRFESSIRIADKNPKHCFRTRFLKEIFPDAVFVFIFRNPRPNINSLIEGWKSGKYQTYTLPASGPVGEVIEWSFDLPPGYPDWANRTLPERSAHQWVGYTSALLDATDRLSTDSYVALRYETLVDKPLRVMSRVFEGIDVPMDPSVEERCRTLPVVNSVSSPEPDKYKKREDQLNALTPIFKKTYGRLREFMFMNVVPADI